MKPANVIDLAAERCVRRAPPDPMRAGFFDHLSTLEVMAYYRPELMAAVCRWQEEAERLFPR